MNIKIDITGIESTTQFLDQLDTRLWTNINKGFSLYVKTHLINRIKNRLANATQAKENSTMVNGIPSSGGGYGVPKNKNKYADWKESRSNLPVIGNLSPRELVATGHLVDSIDVLRVEQTLNSLSYEVGVKPGERPATTAYKNNPPKSTIADLSRQVDNVKLAQILEDTNYAFWVKEFEDVQRDIVPLVTYIIKETILELWKEYNTAK